MDRSTSWYAKFIPKRAAKRKRASAHLPPNVSAAVLPAGGESLRRRILLFAALLLLGYYAISNNWTVYELGRCLLGVAFLWGPIGALLYVLLRRPVEDPIVRLALSCAGSYTLTTLFYFAAAVIGAEWIFGALLLGATAAAVWFGRRLLSTTSIELPRLDSVLLAIVAASLVTTIPYNTSVTVTPSGERVVMGFSDHFYHVGLEYELSRHVPPLQASIRGGSPERAYHMFPHLTAMLLSRFTGRSDMLRAHGVYHYGAIAILICLTLYGIGFLLTSTRTGGYVCASLPFLFAIPMRPILPNTLGYFFFTIFPHATSTVFPTLGTSPQMYSGIAAMYGVLLGIAAIVRMSKAAPGDYVLPIVSGLMAASLLRFRVHCWMAAMPVFLVFVLVMWVRSRRATWLVSGAVALAVSALLYREMSFPIYLRGTAELHFALNRLSDIPFYRVWPFSSSIELLLQRLLPGAPLHWAWEIVCLIGFVVWNIIGIPFCIVLALVPAILKRSQALGYYLFTIGIILLSMALATCLNMGYDRYSIPAQFAYHFGWYVLPLVGVGVAWLVLQVQRRTSRAWVLWIALAATAGITAARTQHALVPTLNGKGVVITPAAWEAFQYLNVSTPGNAVVFSTSPRDRGISLVSGLGGRSGYLDMAPNPVDDQAVRVNPSDNRSLVVNAMAAARDPSTFCAVVTGTPITHILEQASNPLPPNLPCLRRLWTGRDGATAVWQVAR